MQSELESLFVLGTSHHATPLNVRERLALNTEQATNLRKQLHKKDGVLECLVLNTCNRLEVYGLAKSLDYVSNIRNYVCHFLGVEESLFQKYAYALSSLDALQHLFEVTSGLDSQMVGETEIFGQVKQSYNAAQKDDCTGRALNRLFEKSFQAAKSVRSKTYIGRGHVSIGNITVKLARRIFERLELSQVLLVGSGEVGEKTANALISHGVSNISISSRNLGNARKLAHSFGGTALSFDVCNSSLKYFDIIICSTSASKIIFNKKDFDTAMKERPERPCFLIDLAIPRNIDPAVESIENIYLYNLDDLSKIANENLAARKDEINKARDILKKKAWSLWLQLRRQAAIRP